MQLTIRAFGNSEGVVLPKTLLAQAGLAAAESAEVEVVNGAIIIKAHPMARAGWAEAAAAVAKSQDDRLVMGEFGNAGDADLVWTDETASQKISSGPVEW